MGFLNEIFENITGMSKRPEIKGSRFEKFVSDEIFIDNDLFTHYHHDFIYSFDI